MPINKLQCGVSTAGDILDRINQLIDADTAVRLRVSINEGNISDIQDILATMGTSIEDLENGLSDLTTLLDTKITEIYQYAMRKVEFEARRAANNEKFAASGFVHFGKHLTSAGGAINQGLWVLNSQNRTLVLGRSTTAIGNSKNDYPLVNVAGVLTKIEYLNSAARDNYLQFPPAEDGTRTYDSATGVSVTHATPAIAFASETARNKVVTDRVDMWGFEAFLREINNADPFVYANGLIQSLATSINGVTTVSDNVRSITYFAWYEGNTSSRGRGVNWQTASEAQRTVIASDPSNNIYFDDATGKFYQWCIRGRSFAGAGNGDWPLVDSYALHAGYGPYSRLKVQGITDDDTPFEDNTSYSHYRGYNKSNNNFPSVGCFTGHSAMANGKAVNGEIYFLVCGTVNRLNHGAYHPHFNTQGTSTIVNTNGSRVKWWAVDTERKLTSRSDCFNYHGDGGYVASGAIGGSVASNFSGRPDGRFYDAIYTSGQGGVCRDMRYSAWGLTQEDFAEADLAVKSGRYRGVEDAIFSKIVDNEYWLNSNHVNKNNKWLIANGYCFLYIDATSLESGYLTRLKSIIVIDKSKDLIFRMKGDPILGSSYSGSVLRTPVTNVEALYGILGTTGVSSTEIYLVGEYNTETSIAHEYTHTEVMGEPSNILLCDDLKDGWVGSWLSDLPDGTKDEFTLTRLYTGSSGAETTRTHTLDNGVTWTQAATTLADTSKNTVTVTDMPTNQVTVWQYKSNAKITKNSVNTPWYPTLNSEVYVSSDGISSVLRGGLLKYSLVGGLTGTSTFIDGAVQALNLDARGSFLDSGPLITPSNRLAYLPSHGPIHIDGGVNISAFKALNYNVVNSQQGFINYAYTELKHNGTDWGDDGKIHIVDNQTTMLDENGNTVLVGTAQIVEPLGWIKNDK